MYGRNRVVVCSGKEVAANRMGGLAARKRVHKHERSPFRIQ